uniref:NACHT domain-containing protein n=1 Tax=Pygocentrus nattereri TaxID=42514 RepID=A0AAR2JMW0_PYGNA
MKNRKCKKLRHKKLRSYIPEQKQILAPEDLLNSHEKTVLLIGKPGIGKTSVIHKMLFLWSQKDNRELDYMFYFDEATLSQISNPMSLESLLFGLYCKPLEKDKKEVLQDIDENSENVIIVFDGISTLQNNQSLQKIMNQDLPEAKIVLTCRSELEDDSFLSIRSPRKVYVQGFSKESVCKYFEQVMGSDSEFLSLVLNNQELVSLCHVPMYAFMVAACMSFRNPTSPKCPLTVTEMFVQILRQDLKKAGNKKNSELDEYIKATRPRLTSLMESAFNATMQKAVNLSNIDRVDTEISKVLLKKITIKDTPTSVEQYHAFLHNTVQEFFSAMWLLGNPDEMVKVLQLCYTEKRKHLKHTIPFLCGLLFLLKQNPKLLKSFFFEDQIKRASDYALFRNFMNTLFQLQSDGELMDDDEDVDAVFVCQCLYESQSPDACLLFLEKVNYHLDLSGNELDPHQCCAVSYVISQSNERQVHLSLEDCSVSDAGIQMILRIAPHLRCESSTLSVLGCERPHFTTILDAGGRQMHLPVLGEGFMFRKAGKIIRESSEKISLHLHFEEDSQQLSEDLCCMIFQRLPQINSLRFRSPQSESDEWRKRVNSFLMDLCLQAALYQKEDLHPTVKRLMSCASAEEGEFLLDLFSRVKNYETQTGRNVLPALQPVYQSAPAVWIINLSERKSSLFLEVLKLQTVKKPVELTGWSDEESEVRSFLQCLSYISRLRFRSPQSESDEWRKRRNSFLMDLCLQAALYQKEVIYTTVKRLMLCVCAEEGEFLLDLFSHVKNYETQTGRNVLPALQPVYQSAPTVWIINLSERKSSLFLEVLKLQTVKTPVELTGWPDEESEVRSFLQCLPYISWLRFRSPQSESDEWRKRRNSFLMDLCLQAALYQKEVIHTTVKRLMSCASAEEGEFLLDLFSHVKNYETQTGRNVLPALQPVYQSAPAVWIINLSERNSSLFLEVLKLQTVKKPVELTGWPDEEIEVRSFLQCLPYISWLRISSKSYISNGIQMFLGLLIKAAESERQTGEKTLELLTSVCTYSSFPYGHTYSSFPYGSTQSSKQREFLLDLFSHVKNYETQTGRNVLPALQPVYQSAPAVWIINLSERKSSLFLEVLKLQTVKKPVELTGWSDEESEVRSFLQCLSYISQLRISSQSYISNGIQMFLCLLIKAAESERQTGEKTLELLTSVCTYSSFPYGHTYSSFPYGSTHSSKQSEFLLDLFSYVKNYETQTGRNVLPALQPVYQSAPAVWIINLSERQSSLFLEVLKLQTVKKPVELTGWSDEESEVRSFLQCLPYISQLRISSQSYISNGIQMFLCLLIKAAESERQTGEKTLELLTSVCTYSSFPYGDTHSSISYVYSHSSFPYGHTYSSFPYGSTQSSKQREFLLNLFSHVKNYETQTGRNVLPALQPVYQSAPAVWIINLSERQSSLFLEVLKLQTVKKPVELTGWSDEESEVRSFLQCLSYISQLRISFQSYISNGIQMFLCLLIKAAESERQTGEKTLELLTSVCTYTSFPYGSTHSSKQREFLLDLFSHVKNYETQTGRNVLPALQPVYQSAPAVWIINLSERKSSLFLEVLKLQTVKKPVELTGWPDEESEVRSFLQCLPYISQLRISFQSSISNDIQMFLHLLIKAAESERQTGEKTLELLTSVCTYSSFPYGDTHSSKQREFLLDLFSHVKNYETQTGRNVLPALQPVYHSAPAEWIINLSERKSSLFLEVLKLQTVKKPVELTGWSDEESEVRSFLQCLPYISQLRGAELCIRSLCKVMHSREEVEQVALLLQALNFTVSLGGKLSTSSCRFVGRVLGLSASTLNLTLNPQSISLRGSRLLFRHISHLQTLRLDGAMMVKVVRALRALRASTSVTVEELSLILSRRQRSEGELSRVLSSLSSLLRLWNVQCVNLTEHTMEVQPLTVLLCHKGSLTIRLSKETLQQLVLVVYETQEEEFTRCFLQKVGGDLTSCSLNWDVIHYFLQFHPVSVDFRKSNINQQNIRELVSVLDRIQLRCVDRLLLLKLLHCCSVSEGKTAAVLLSALQHRLDFSCSSTLDLTAPTNTLTLSTEDCRVISMTIQRAQTNTELLLQDCEMEEAGVEQLYTILHSVRLNCSKALLLQFLSLVHVGLDCVRRAMALHRALGEELDLSQTKLDLQACRSLALFLEHSEGLSELDLSHCQLTDHCLELLLPHLHKTHILDLSNNDITDWKARDILSLNSNVKTVRLFNNRITEKQLFMSDRRFEIWRS